MTRTINILGAVAAAGGAAWLAKLAVIAATDGETTSTGAAAVFYVLGAILMAAGAGTLTLRAARGRATAVIAALLAPVIWAISFMVLDAVAKPLVGDAGPSWLRDEAGIALTGLVWVGVGLGSRVRTRASLAAKPASASAS